MSGRIRSFLMPVGVALWFAFLILPFKGIMGAAVVFGCLLVAVPLFGYLKRIGGAMADLSAVFGRYLPADRRYLAALSLPLLFLPSFSEAYVIDVAVLCGIYVILALGLNVVVGFAGLLNLGFVAFYAIGAYSYALLNTRLGLGFWEALPFSLLLTTLSGFLLAFPALRLKGDYLALVTLGFGEIVRLVLNNWDGFTRGPNGISGIATPALPGLSLDTMSHFYYLVMVCTVIAVFVIDRVRQSRIGRAWFAIREDEIASSAMGINTLRYKLYSFAFGAFWAGLAGCLFAAKMRFVSPESFTFMESVIVLCMVIIGGLGSIPGVIAGTMVLVFLPEVLREVQLYRMLALGAGLVFLMVFRPQGLFGGKGVSAGG